jgi:hypothetical protein
VISFTDCGGVGKTAPRRTLRRTSGLKISEVRACYGAGAAWSMKNRSKEPQAKTANGLEMRRSENPIGAHLKSIYPARSTLD